MRSLIVFEAAARHRTFSAAARELAMTQAAISQQIAHLEADLGTALFARHHRGVDLTPAGQRLLPPVIEGLRALAAGVAAAQRQKRERTVTILTDFGFASWWLMPRIGALSDLMPEVEFRLTTVQNHADALGSECDLAILFGDGIWPDCTATRLFAEEIYPVCAPSYLAARELPLKGPLKPDIIARQRLLHLRSTEHMRWFTWADWCEAMHVGPIGNRHDLGFNNYQIVVQAALLGQGVALGWAPLIDDMVAGGTLVRLGNRPLTSERGYHLIRPVQRVQDRFGGYHDADHGPDLRAQDTAQACAWLLESARKQQGHQATG